MKKNNSEPVIVELNRFARKCSGEIVRVVFYQPNDIFVITPDEKKEPLSDISSTVSGFIFSNMPNTFIYLNEKMSYAYSRMASFKFVLLHEIGHIKTQEEFYNLGANAWEFAANSWAIKYAAKNKMKEELEEAASYLSFAGACPSLPFSDWANILMEKSSVVRLHPRH